MKNLVTLAAVGVLVFCGYKYYTDKIQGGRLVDSPEMATGTAKPAPGQAVTISRMIADWHVALFSDLNRKAPQDLVPPLTVAKERIANSRRLVEQAKYPIYDTATALLGRMIDAAEERTKALDAMLQAKENDKSSMDSKGTVAGSRAFFAETATRRWEAEKQRRKPAIDQMMAQLRALENQWNSKLASGAAIDSFNLDSLKPVLVSVRTTTSGPAANAATTGVIYPWRRSYYAEFSSQVDR